MMKNRFDQQIDALNELMIEMGAMVEGTIEDACAALMEAQLGAGQRAAAIDTYLSCRRYLVEELGIDPSPSIVALYRSAVEAEEALE